MLYFFSYVIIYNVLVAFSMKTFSNQSMILSTGIMMIADMIGATTFIQKEVAADTTEVCIKAAESPMHID